MVHFSFVHLFLLSAVAVAVTVPSCWYMEVHVLIFIDPFGNNDSSVVMIMAFLWLLW